MNAVLAVSSLLLGVLAGLLAGQWFTRKSRACWHHAPTTGESWIGSGQLVDLGRRKMWRCRECGRTWFT